MPELMNKKRKMIRACHLKPLQLFNIANSKSNVNQELISEWPEIKFEDLYLAPDNFDEMCDSFVSVFNLTRMTIIEIDLGTFVVPITGLDVKIIVKKISNKEKK